MEELTGEVKQFARDQGMDLVGIAATETLMRLLLKDTISQETFWLNAIAVSLWP